ncbi:MAG: NF038122 family metalloprotease, partial [Pirellulaceae bacterium]|nr:NF038122 family metalloprotease [Pirellulaceae bacterium]
RPRPDARLRVDPSLIVKLDASRIDMEPGAQLIAEGRDGHEIIFTHILDDRYGVGGTYDTTNDGANVAFAGGWGGIHATLSSRLSIDHSIFAYGGGITRIEGTFAGFNVLEIHQAEARIANSIFEFNAGGVGGQSPVHRFGRGFNRPALMFVRGAQPIIVDNIFRENQDSDDTSFLAPIDINVNSLNSTLKHDYGRSTGAADALPGYRQNHGPLVVGNRLGNNEINGMVIRGETLTTQSIWDDADIVHVVLDQITVPDLHTYGGLRLASNPTQSLVVKLEGTNAGFVAEGQPRETDDRVGGVIQIVGQPKSPVVLTSLRNDDFGAGVDQNGDPQVDTNNDGEATGDVSQSTINVNYDTGTVSAEAIVQIDKAAAFWQRTLKDPVTIGMDVSFAALGGNTIGQASPQTHSANFNEVRQRMIGDAGPHEQIVTQLPTRNELDVSTASAANTITMTQANALALGYAQGDFANQATSAFGTGAIHGVMQFQNGLDLDPDQLYLVAVHEIGHLLGFISAVGQGNPSLTTLDLFRL